MKKAFYIFFLILFSSQLIGQSNCKALDKQLDSLINNLITSLKQKNVDAFCIYSSYSPGSRQIISHNPIDSCVYNGTFFSTYIFWISGKQTLMTKKDHCFNYSEVKIDDDSFWTFYLSNLLTIKKEKIKSPECKTKKNGKTSFVTVTIDHSNRQNIDFILRNDTTAMYFDDFCFSKQVALEDKWNINYESNLKTKRKQLQLKLQKLISDIEQKQILTKTRQ